ncbi:MAG TPA: hypothetical protein VEN30_22130 [Paraburkholderia sp.]|nr:hypothetical protein [Paraburkholderia sp.]
MSQYHTLSRAMRLVAANRDYNPPVALAPPRIGAASMPRFTARPHADLPRDLPRRIRLNQNKRF